MSVPDKLVEALVRLRGISKEDIVAALNREIVPFLREMRQQYNAHQHADEAGCCGCCPKKCTTVTTVGDTSNPAPDFDIAVADGQLVEIVVTGFVVKLTTNVSGQQGGFVYLRAIARRYDADNVFSGLAVLMQDSTLSSLSTGLAISASASGNTLRVLLDGADGTYRWDLEMYYCIKDQIVDTEGGA